MREDKRRAMRRTSGVYVSVRADHGLERFVRYRAPEYLVGCGQDEGIFLASWRRCDGAWLRAVT